MDSLAKVTLSLNSYEFKEIDINTIKEALENVEENKEMLYFLGSIKVDLNKKIPYQDKIEYFSSLINKALSVTKINYAPEFFDLFLSYLMRMYINIEPESLELIKKTIKKFDKILDELTDETWYILYSLKYTLLNNINYDEVFSSSEKLEDLKNMLEELKNSKERYELIQNTEF